MDIPRGHAAMPLLDIDFLDFIYTYFKAEYAPIRSIWSTATADPRHASRWMAMGHELSPLSIRPANAQAQKDLESLDYFTRKFHLDAGFVRGLVLRFAKYEVHERLEKKLYECARLDLMVRKALKEKHVIDALWPSPAPRNLSQELLAQGVQVRKWYGDMFNKYFRVLHAVDEFELRPEVDQRIKSAGTLMLVPFVDHLVFGTVDPILPIVARGAGYSNAKGWRQGDRTGGSARSEGFGEQARFEIRFDAPAEVVDTYTKSVVRQCQCNKCGTKRDVQVVISVDPTPAGANAMGSSKRRQSGSSTSDQRKTTSKTAQRYAPGYNMPGEHDTAPRKPPRPRAVPEEPPRAATPEQKKQCPRCTFLNHPELTACEMCQAVLPNITIEKPPSPGTQRSPPPSSSTAQEPPVQADPSRPAHPNRNSLSATLFSIFPFSQQQQQEHHAKLPPTQEVSNTTASRAQQPEMKETETPAAPVVQPKPRHPVRDSEPSASTTETSKPATPPPRNPVESTHDHPETPLSRAPEMTLMPLTPPPTVSKRPAPAGMPSNLMDDFVAVSPGFVQEEDDEDAGWGEMSKEEGQGAEDDDEDEDGRGHGRGMVDLDAVAREEADVWGEREE